MLKQNLKLFIRSIKKHKSTFLINVIGLSTAMACVILITLWVTDELSIDKFHENDEQLYQVLKNNWTESGIETGEDTPAPLALALVNEMPEVEQAASVFPSADFSLSGTVSIDKTYFRAKSKFVGGDFFDLFSYTLISGSKQAISEDKMSFVISDKLAKKLFPNEKNVIGQVVEWEGKRVNGPFTITGVFEDHESDSSIQFDVLFNYNLLLDTSDSFKQWYQNGSSTYVLLKENTKVTNFNVKIKDFIKTKHQDSNLTLFARPYSNRYLYGEFKNGKVTGGRIIYVRLFIIVALFILVIACINFINLSTSRASRRLKEIGMKKVLGATKKNLIYQYLGESTWTALGSMLIALGLVLVVLPSFNHITGKQLSMQFNLPFVIALITITLLTGLASGFYPALYLSKFKPLTILKGKLSVLAGKNSWSNFIIRKGLIVFQFAISVILIVSVLVVYGQMEYIHSKNLGFVKENVITFPAEGKIASNLDTYIKEVKKISGVLNASYMNGDLTEIHGGTTALAWENKQPDDVVDFELLGTGSGLIETLGMEMIAGRPFSEEFETETTKIIFNETAIKSMGLQNPIGKTVTLWDEPKEIIGIVKDFHFESLYENVKPFFFRFRPKAKNIVVKINTSGIQETLAQIENFSEGYNQGLPFEFHFLDKGYQKLYASEQRVSQLSKYFAVMAILISCLGLLGLAIFTAERRRKEISIRKVLGQSAAQVTLMLSSDFAKLVVIAIIIALPIAYLLTNNWLSGFAYRISLQVWYFLGAGLVALAVAMLTVGSQAINAANKNPVNGLRDE